VKHVVQRTAYCRSLTTTVLQVAVEEVRRLTWGWWEWYRCETHLYMDSPEDDGNDAGVKYSYIGTHLRMMAMIQVW